MNGSDDSGGGAGDDGTAPPSADSSATQGPADASDGGASSGRTEGGPKDAAPTPATDGAAAGADAAGKAGTDAFCNQICSHEQHCATVLDASMSGLTNCVSDCQSLNESPTTSPPTELLRADYVSALGTCIAASSCNDAPSTSEANCAAAILSGSPDAGVPAIKPTAAVAGLCHELETSPCVMADSGVQNCDTAFLLYSDQALNAAIACFSSSSCSQAASCYAAALMQM